MRITGLYAALLALWMVVLAVRVTRLRRDNSVGLGDGGHRSVACAVRAHGNAAEYVPLALILLLVLELNQTLPMLLHVFGIVLVVARIVHAVGLSSTPGVSKGRLVGMALTVLVIVAMALMLLWQYLVIHVIAPATIA